MEKKRAFGGMGMRTFRGTIPSPPFRPIRPPRDLAFAFVLVSFRSCQLSPAPAVTEGKERKIEAREKGQEPLLSHHVTVFMSWLEPI